MSSNQTQRPSFFEGQFLGAEDLTAAVAYSRIQQARHWLGAHTWGIAAGLQLTEKALAGGQVEMYLLPGYAWDGFGRPIVVLTPYKIPTEQFKAYLFDSAIDGGTPEGRLIEVWLRYDEARTGNVRPGFEVCDTEDQRTRVQETFRIEVGARPSHIDRHDRITIAGNPIDALEALQRFEPQTPALALFDESVAFQDLPESDAKARWLMPLGYVRWKPNPNPNQSGNFVKREPQDLAKSRSLRRYIGVVAESLQAADGVLRLRNRTQDYSQVQSDDLVWVEGKLRVEGDVRLFGGKLEFRHNDGRDFDIPLKVQRSGDPGAGARALQVIVGPEAQTNNRLAVGPLKADGTVAEKFVVLSGGNVGIGTAAPDRALTLQGAAGTYLNVKGDAGSHEVLVGADSNGGIVSTMTNHDLQLRAGTNVTRMVIKADGKVAIGTSSPTGQLTIKGAIQPQQGVLTFFSPTADVEYDGGSDGIFVIKDTGGKTAFMGGNIGIGTETPAFKLDVGDRMRVRQGAAGSAGIWFFQSGPNADRAFVGMATDNHVGFWGKTAQWGVIMDINSGNVGIGTMNPSRKLDVNGDIHANGAGDFNGAGSFNGNVSINGTLTANVKNFRIPHPLNPEDQHLIHSALEGPEIAVFYRGTSQLADGEATISLPDYFEVLTRTENRTVLLTPKFEDSEPISALAASGIKDGRFKVRAIDDKNLNQQFYWEVKAVRADVDLLSVTD